MEQARGVMRDVLLVIGAIALAALAFLAAGMVWR